MPNMLITELGPMPIYRRTADGIEYQIGTMIFENGRAIMLSEHDQPTQDSRSNKKKSE